MKTVISKHRISYPTKSRHLAIKQWLSDSKVVSEIEKTTSGENRGASIAAGGFAPSNASLQGDTSKSKFGGEGITVATQTNFDSEPSSCIKEKKKDNKSDGRQSSASNRER